jgi:hypothetical protein
MEKKIEVVLVSSDPKEHTPLGFQTHGSGQDLVLGKVCENKSYGQGNSFNPYYPQHLYFLSDDEIQKDDWVVYRKNGLVELLKSELIYQGGIVINNGHEIAWISNSKKVIATTNDSIGYTDLRISPVNNFCDYPKPSQAFIEHYVEQYKMRNIIKWVNVEYEKYYGPSNFSHDNYFLPKVNSDNTINISPTKESWSKEELHDIIANHEYDKGVIDWMRLIPDLAREINYPLSDNWNSKI